MMLAIIKLILSLDLAYLKIKVKPGGIVQSLKARVTTKYLKIKLNK